jgi:hypothetical protein
MTRPSTFVPYQQGTQKARTTKTAKGAADFLRANDKMASILPTVTRMAALQKDCTATLPAMFATCAVLSLENEQLVLAVPNAALASKLKQQLPKLQDNLLKRGWQVSAIRLKVQVITGLVKTERIKELNMPMQAVSAFDSLENGLEETPQNKTLKAALRALIERQRGQHKGG